MDSWDQQDQLDLLEELGRLEPQVHPASLDHLVLLDSKVPRVDRVSPGQQGGLVLLEILDQKANKERSDLQDRRVIEDLLEVLEVLALMDRLVNRDRLDQVVMLAVLDSLGRWDRLVSLGGLDHVDPMVLLDRGVKLASLDLWVHKAILDHRDLRESRYQEVLEQLVKLELLVELESEDLWDLLDHRVREVHKDRKELLDLLDSKDHKEGLETKDLRDKPATLDLWEVKVYRVLLAHLVRLGTVVSKVSLVYREIVVSLEQLDRKVIWDSQDRLDLLVSQASGELLDFLETVDLRVLKDPLEHQAFLVSAEFLVPLVYKVQQVLQDLLERVVRRDRLELLVWRDLLDHQECQDLQDLKALPE